MRRPPAGTAEELIYDDLLGRMSRQGVQVDLEGCARLAALIQAKGHKHPDTMELANKIGMDPNYLSRERKGRKPDAPDVTPTSTPSRSEAVGRDHVAETQQALVQACLQHASAGTVVGAHMSLEAALKERTNQ